MNDDKKNLGSRGLKHVAVQCTVMAISLYVSTVGFYIGEKEILAI